MFVVDAASFVIAAGTLLLIRRPFQQREGPAHANSIRADVAEGLQFVWRQPVLRALSVLMAVYNLVGATRYSQLVLLAENQYHAPPSRIGWFYAAGSAGIVVLSFAAGPLRRRLPFGRAALGCLVALGAVTTLLGTLHTLWKGLLLWRVASGLTILFIIMTSTLRQEIVPDQLLGRVQTVSAAVAWSMLPVGSLLGGYAVARVGAAGPVYALVGLLTALIAVVFTWSAIGRASWRRVDTGSGVG